MKIVAVFVSLAMTAGLVGCQGGIAKPKSDDDKTIYSIAYETGKKFRLFQLTDGEMKVFRKGLQDGLKDAKEEIAVYQQLSKAPDFIQKRSAQFTEKKRKR